jgi:two-component system cell cycle sensor histidine kinase/response regulator CckA
MGAIVKISSPIDLPPTAFDAEGKSVPTVLIVDDEPIVRNLVRLALSEAGYTVLDATGASEAIDLCRSLGEQEIDLLIIDHGLAPDKGRVVAESIVKFSPSVKVLVTSGWTYQTVHDEDGFPPGSSFLQKPFTAQQLLSIVQNVLFPGMQ